MAKTLKKGQRVSVTAPGEGKIGEGTVQGPQGNFIEVLLDKEHDGFRSWLAQPSELTEIAPK